MTKCATCNLSQGATDAELCEQKVYTQSPDTIPTVPFLITACTSFFSTQYRTASRKMHTICITYPLAPPMVDMGDKEASVRDPQRVRGSRPSTGGSSCPHRATQMNLAEPPSTGAGKNHRWATLMPCSTPESKQEGNRKGQARGPPRASQPSPGKPIHRV